ncbi:MAG: hypothetical protein ACR2OG_12730 [Gemmatimonadaceae bacterium]
MAKILLVGTETALLEGLMQTLAAVGHNAEIAGSVSDALRRESRELPLVTVVDRALAIGDPLTIHLPVARGGALVLYHHGAAGLEGATPSALQRSVLAELALPLERHRLLAIIQHVEDRVRSTGRDRLPTPPEHQRHT